MKDTFYFSHDYNARSDEKIKKLIRKHKMLGYGIFWAIIEDLYNNANALHLDYEGIALDYRTNPQIIRSIIHDFDLFQIDSENFYSNSVQDRLESRNTKSAKARESAYKRWNKDANALQTECEGNAKKERKGKEIKGEESETQSLFENSIYLPINDIKDKLLETEQFRLFYESNNLKYDSAKLLLENFIKERQTAGDGLREFKDFWSHFLNAFKKNKSKSVPFDHKKIASENEHLSQKM